VAIVFFFYHYYYYYFNGKFSVLPSLLNEGDQGLALNFSCFLEIVPTDPL